VPVSGVPITTIPAGGYVGLRLASLKMCKPVFLRVKRGGLHIKKLVYTPGRGRFQARSSLLSWTPSPVSHSVSARVDSSPQHHGFVIRMLAAIARQKEADKAQTRLSSFTFRSPTLQLPKLIQHPFSRASLDWPTPSSYGFRFDRELTWSCLFSRTTQVGTNRTRLFTMAKKPRYLQSPMGVGLNWSSNFGHQLRFHAASFSIATGDR